MPTTAPSTPYLAKNFRVEIDNIAAASFSEVTGLSAAIEVVDYRNGASLENNAQKVPGLGSYSNIILRRGMLPDISLWNWIHSNLTGTPDRRNVSIILLDQAENPAWTWKLTNAWPCRWSGPDLVADSSNVAMETLEICYETLQPSIAS